jgi:hypothetical protein
MQQEPLRSSQTLRKNTHREGELFSHWVVLIFCVGILLGGVVLSPPHPGSSYLHIGPIPIRDIMHGDFKASLFYHRLGLLTLVYICVQFLYRLVVIFVLPLRARLFGLSKILNRGIIVLAVLYLVNWGYTLIF